MKKKILSILITILSLCTCIFTLTACDDKEPPHTHEYSTLKYDNLSHWYECSCGEYETKEEHKGGTATETNKATCSVCNQEYGESLGHIHTLHLTRVEAKPQSCTEEGNIEYYTCSCDKWFTDNTAITEITDKESVVIAKDDHEYKELKKSATEHWYECICGDKYGIENHKGGTATCQVKATCSVCETVYGNLAEHSPKQDWIKTETHHYHECVYGCTEKLNYGEHNFDNNKKCNDCDYVTTALLGTEISSEIYQINGTNLSLKVPNEQTNFSFAKTINVAKGATYKVYTDISCKETYCIPSYAVNNLSVGNNTYYFLVSNGTEIPQVYTVKIRRRPMYTVTFNTDGGTSVSNQVIEEDSLATEPLTTKTGYDFVSWNYDFNTPITDNITITAEWNIKQYTLTIVYDNGQENLVLTQDYNTHIQTIESPKKLGYSFAGWDNAMPSTMPAEDLIVTAKWTINKYILTIVYDNGQEDLILTQDYNTPIQPISNPVRDGYAFTDWDNVIPNTMPAENLTITATWEANKDTPYKVEYYLQNLEDDKYTKTQTVDKTGTTDTIAKAEIKTFTHFTHKASSTDSGNIASNGLTVLKVYYTRDKYTVTFDGDGGTLTSGKSSQKVKYGGSVTAPTFNRTGYTFTGYDKTNYANISESFTVTAMWNVITYTISYELNDGVLEENNNPTLYTIETSTILLSSIPRKINYVFEGWFNGDKKISEIKKGDFGDLRLTAKWKYALIISESEISDVYDCFEIQIPNNITSIGSRAFKDCSSLTSITIPNSVTSIGDYAFSDCNSLIKVNYLGNVDQWVGISFSNEYSNPIFYAKKLYINNELVKEVSLTTATEISKYAFYNCASLIAIIIGENITNIADYAFYNCRFLTEIKYNAITCSDLGNNQAFSYAGVNGDGVKVIIGASVKRIPDRLFHLYYTNKKANITEVVFEEGAMCESIGSWAFSACDLEYNVKDGLKYLGNGNNKYEYLIDVENYTINSATIIESCKLICESAFSSCCRLVELCNNSSLNIKKGDYGLDCLLNIYSDSSGNSKLSIEDGFVIYVDGEEKVLCGYKGTEINLVIPNGVTTINSKAFSNCYSLMSVTIPDSVTSIGGGAFSACYSLMSVTIPDSVTSIGEHVFNGCFVLTVYHEIDGREAYHNGHDYIPTVWNCNNNDIATDGCIYSVIDGVRYTINNGIAHVGMQPRYITTANIRETISYKGNIYNVTSIDSSAFSNCFLLTSITIPNSVTAIGPNTFSGCQSLISVTIGNSVTSISSNAFSGCSSLTSIVIPNSVTSISSNAFSNCAALTTVTIGNSVTSIGKEVFFGCTSLTSVTFSDTSTWYRTTNSIGCTNKTGGEQTSVTSSSINATNFNSNYCIYYWYKI